MKWTEESGGSKNNVENQMNDIESYQQTFKNKISNSIEMISCEMNSHLSVLCFVCYDFYFSRLSCCCCCCWFLSKILRFFWMLTNFSNRDQQFLLSCRCCFFAAKQERFRHFGISFFRRNVSVSLSSSLFSSSSIWDCACAPFFGFWSECAMWK